MIQEKAHTLNTKLKLLWLQLRGCKMWLRIVFSLLTDKLGFSSTLSPSTKSQTQLESSHSQEKGIKLNFFLTFGILKTANLINAILQKASRCPGSMQTTSPASGRDFLSWKMNWYLRFCLKQECQRSCLDYSDPQRHIHQIKKRISLNDRSRHYIK